MGTSNWQNIGCCVEYLRMINPKSVLDIGVGFGRWGILAHEFLDTWNGRVMKDDWTLKVDGVEAYSKIIFDYHKAFYSQIYEMEASVFFEMNQSKYDVVIFGDVLEHMKKDVALKCLDDALAIADYVLINIPIGDDWEQGELYGNNYERHLSVWNDELYKYNVIRQRKFFDYLGRTSMTYVITTNKDSNYLNDKFLINEIREREAEIRSLYCAVEDLNIQLDQQLKKKKRDIEEVYTQINSKESYVVRLDIVGKDSLSKGFECWLYDIKTDLCSGLPFSEYVLDDFAMREDINGRNGEVLVGTQLGSYLEFRIVGGVLKLKCLTHPWSGLVSISANGNEICQINLFSETFKIKDFEIRIN